MKIIDHHLCKDDETPYPSKESPNSGGKVIHEYLVIHYTASRNAQESVDWLTNPKSKASAHLVIGRDGSITQLVPFNTKAWHAGASIWEGRVGLNMYSIGIELDNAGRLTRSGNQWCAWFGDPYDESEVLEAVHKYETGHSGWHIYTPEQIDAVLKVGVLLFSHYKLRDVVGHDDISPGRKADPGPAFPMHSFRARLLGRSEEKDVQYETTTSLNIHTDAGTQYPLIPGSPLPPDTRVELLNRKGNWALVDVVGIVKGVMDMEGWVHIRYLKRVI
jgi:N-acetylmuramoyl-L-alanine amidase